jgi:acetyl esterase/lipase
LDRHGGTKEGNAIMSYVAQRNVVCVQVDGIGLLMDVFVPTVADAPGKGYGLVCVASGGWTAQRNVTDAHEKAGYFRELCQRGFTVFAVRPGSSSAFTIDQMVAYVHMMIREIRTKVGEYAIKKQWLGLTGVSAGGHLAALSAMRAIEGAEGTAVQAVGLICPATDLLDWGGADGTKHGPYLKDWRLIFPGGAAGKTEQQKVEAARAVSPVYQAKAGLPPYFIAHGDKDDAVPLPHAEKLAKALKGAGVAARYVVIPGGNHDWPQLIGQVGPMADWLVEQLPK